MPRPRSQSGFTLIEAMLAVAILGVIMVVVDKLILGGLMAWAYSKSSFSAQNDVRITREQITKQLHEASASSVVISRTGTAQPEGSMITFVDVQGNTFTYYQHLDTLRYTADWASGPLSATSESKTLILSDLQRLRFYYPENKDYTKIGVMFQVERWPLPNAPSARQVPNRFRYNGIVLLRNP
jgi:prepilin-type N-terminal cleavage/methylation domain-containing protein